MSFASLGPSAPGSTETRPTRMWGSAGNPAPSFGRGFGEVDDGHERVELLDGDAPFDDDALNAELLQPPDETGVAFASRNRHVADDDFLLRRCR